MKRERRLRLSAGIFSTLTASLLMITKGAAAHYSGSVGLFASALDSAFDLFSSIIILVSIVVASQPADHCHRYGHGKAEALSGFIQSIFVFISAIYIMFQAVQRYYNPVPLTFLNESLGVMIFATIMTAILVLFQGYVAKQTGSIAIKADRMHYFVDLASNMVVILSLALEKFLDLRGMDILAGILVSIYIMRGSYGVFRDSFDIIMDRDISDVYRNFIVAFVDKNRPDVVGYHDLRSRSTGNIHYVEIHLEIDRNLSFEKSHRYVEKLVSEIQARFKNTEITVHSDPAIINRSNGNVNLVDQDTSDFF